MYQQMIRESMARQGQIGAAPAHCVEAWMRLEHGTLDALGRQQFDAEVAAGVACHRADPVASESLAESYGLEAVAS